MTQNPSTKLLFLPPLQDKSSVGAGQPGVWQYDTNVAFDKVAESLELPEGREIENLASIPDMWARPLWVEMVLTGDAPHPLRPILKAQWQGMLAAIALAKAQGFKLRAQFLDLRQSQSNNDEFISSLLQLIPSPEKTIYKLEDSKKNPWENIFLFLWDERPVGMTSPSTLICPSGDGDWTGLPWWSEGKLRSPIEPEDCLIEDEKIQLWLWLDRLKSELENCTGNYAGKIKELAIEFQNELVESLKQELRIESQRELVESLKTKTMRLARTPRHFGEDIVLGPVATLNTPIEGKPMPSSVVLTPQIKQIGKEEVVFIPDPKEIVKQWKNKKDKDIWIYDTNLINFNLEEFKKKYKGEYLTSTEIFLEDFYFIKESKQLPGALMPTRYEEVTYTVEGNEYQLTPLLPINQKLFRYFTSEELIKIIELQPIKIGPESGVQISLNLPLSGGEYRINKDYPIKKENALAELPNLEIWPNFKAVGWQEYYGFYYSEKLDETNKTFRVKFPNYQAQHPEELDKFQLTRLEEFPAFIICQDEAKLSLELGLILLKTPPRYGDGDPNKTWTVGVDFGTSFTNVYYSINQQANPLSLSALNLQVTETSGATRLSLLYDNFISGIEQQLPLASVLTTKGTKGQTEPIFDGRIYIPENLDEFDPKNADIKTNLKWDSQTLQYNQLFLEHLALSIAAEAAIKNVRIIEWSISYPSSFAGREKNIYSAHWQRIIEDLQAKTGLEHKMLPRAKGKFYRSESLALAHYFDAEAGEDLLYTTCIDMGGGSSDISIWLNHRLIHQCSVLLAGNLLFSQFVKQKPQFVQQQFDIDVSSLAGGLKDEPFYTKLNSVLSGKGEKWLREKRALLDDEPDLQYVLTRTAIGISGLYYYVGTILNALNIEGLYVREENTPVYIGGNGSRIFHWLAPGGLFDSSCNAHRLFSRMLSKGSGFLDTSEETVLSTQPKSEVACGLVLDQKRTRLIGLDDEDEDPFAGEDCYVNGEYVSWKSRLKLPEDVQNFQVPELLNLSSFLDDFHQALTDLKIKDIKPLEEYRDQNKWEYIWKKTKRRLDDQLLKNYKGNSDELRREPPFILALKSLLQVLRGDKNYEKS